MTVHDLILQLQVATDSNVRVETSLVNGDPMRPVYSVFWRLRMGPWLWTDWCDEHGDSLEEALTRALGAARLAKAQVYEWSKPA